MIARDQVIPGLTLSILQVEQNGKLWTLNSNQKRLIKLAEVFRDD